MGFFPNDFSLLGTSGAGCLFCFPYVCARKFCCYHQQKSFSLPTKTEKSLVCYKKSLVRTWWNSSREKKSIYLFLKCRYPKQLTESSVSNEQSRRSIQFFKKKKERKSWNHPSVFSSGTISRSLSSLHGQVKSEPRRLQRMRFRFIVIEWATEWTGLGSGLREAAFQIFKPTSIDFRLPQVSGSYHQLIISSISLWNRSCEGLTKPNIMEDKYK